jgi:zinc/manganese transport system substrate-binding protein
LVDLIRKEKPDAILSTGYYERKAPDYLAGKSGVKLVVLPHDVGSTPHDEDWFSLMDQIIQSLR